MQKLKKFSLIIAIIFGVTVYAIDVVPIIQNFDDGYTAVSLEMEEYYKIYNQQGEVINTSQSCEVGDMFVSADNVLYEIYYVDNSNKVAYAKVKTKVNLPKVNNALGQFEQITTQNKVVCMYHTHNDESYVLGDGYDSVYGKGGVMDIGELLSEELNKLNITVYRSEAMHLPHDYYAYSRSNPTAKSLINNYSPDAIFDVHRDGVARNQYTTTVNGINMSKVRMVIGKSNSNYATNLDFALAIKAYADKNYPNFIKDIYMGSGHYNQALSATAILFEMGTYLIEKDYVKSSVPILANIIDKVMYAPTVVAPSEDKTFNEVIEDLKISGELNNTLNSTNSSDAKTIVVTDEPLSKSNTAFDIFSVAIIAFILFFGAIGIKLVVNKIRK